MSTRNGEQFPIIVDAERLAQMIAHRACLGVEHDPANGKLHGYCVVCGVPWPCDYAGPKPDASQRSETGTREFDLEAISEVMDRILAGQRELTPAEQKNLRGIYDKFFRKVGRAGSDTPALREPKPLELGDIAMGLHQSAPVSDEEKLLHAVVHEFYIEYGAKMYQKSRKELRDELAADQTPRASGERVTAKQLFIAINPDEAEHADATISRMAMWQECADRLNVALAQTTPPPSEGRK